MSHSKKRRMDQDSPGHTPHKPRKNHTLNGHKSHTSNGHFTHHNGTTPAQAPEPKEQKELSPSPSTTTPHIYTPHTLAHTDLLFKNDTAFTNKNVSTNIDINTNKNIVSTPMGFNLSQPEIISVLLQYLDNAGYAQSVQCLANESGQSQSQSNRFEHKTNLKPWIIKGNWEQIMEWLGQFKLSSLDRNFEFDNYYITPQNLFYAKVLILEQKFLELIYHNSTLLATDVMNKELIPLVSPHTTQRFENIPNTHLHCNINDSDIQLLSQLTNRHMRANNNNVSNTHINIPIIAMDVSDNLYPIWRWNKLCKLLYIDCHNNSEIKTELNTLNWYNISDSRYKLYNAIRPKLVHKNKVLFPNNHTLLNIFDQFIKCQLLQSNHFNLRDTNVSLLNVSNNINIPSQTYYVLQGHSDEITHLSFSKDGQWLVSSGNDKRTLVWDFQPIINTQQCISNHQIKIIYDILHYQTVINHCLSRNKQYLITITEHMPELDDFKHCKDRKNYIRRENDRHTYPNKSQFKYTYADLSHHSYYDYGGQGSPNGDNGRESADNVMMDTERGCNIYLWRLDSLTHVLIRQYHHYRREASVCWCPDSKYYFVTSYGNDIDLYSLSHGQIICTLPCNGNLMTDLRLTHHGYRLCVTINSRDVRVYITDFNVYYNALRKYNRLNKRRKTVESVPQFVPWLHFTHKNYTNLFQNNISNYITKFLYAKQDSRTEWNDTYNDLILIAKQSRAKNEQSSDNSDDNSSYSYSDSQSSSGHSTSVSEECNNSNGIVINKWNNNQSMLSETESLESIDDKLWILYEEGLELDKKSNGQLRNDMIVSTAVSYGGEYEYLVVMVHEFVINNNISKQIKHPIILLIDLRNINFNVNYNNCDKDNNHKNVFGIKCFYGFKQDRFKLQCGFGGFKLPPISNRSYEYVQSKYRNGQELSRNESVLRHERQRELKRKLGLNLTKSSKRGSKSRKQTQSQSQSQYCAVLTQKSNGVQFKLNKSELRNLRIPFVQSLESESLSNLQNEIHQRVDTHYSHHILPKKSAHKSGHKSKHRKGNNRDIITENTEIITENDTNLMIETMVNLALKYPKFLPSKLITDLECNIDECVTEDNKAMIENLFRALPMHILQKLYTFMLDKVERPSTNISIGTEETTNDIKRTLLQCEILNAFKYGERFESLESANGDYEQLDSSSSTAMSSGSLNSLSHSLNNNKYTNYSHKYTFAKYNKESLKKKCFQLKEKREKFRDSKNIPKNGRNHYLFQKYVRQQIVSDNSDLRYFTANIDKLLLKYGDCDADSERWTHLSMEMKYFIWHKYLKQMHYHKMQKENYHKISRKKKKKKLKKLQNLNVENKIRSAIKKKKKNGAKFNNNFAQFLDCANETKKQRKKRRHKLDKSRRSNEDIQIEENESDKKEKTVSEIEEVKSEKKSLESHNCENDISICNKYSSSSSENNDSDLNEYVACENAQFGNDELNQINLDLYPGYHKNNSIHKMDLSEMESISQLINNKKAKSAHYMDCEAVSEYEGNGGNGNNSLLSEEYVLNDFFGGHHFIVSGSEDGNVCIWNRVTQKMIKLYGHRKSVNCVAWNPVDSFILVSGSDDTEIRVWGPKKT